MAAAPVIPVVWLSYTDGEHPEDKWDAGMLRLLFDGDLWTPVGAHTFEHRHDLPATGGAVVVFPAGIHRDQYDRLNADLAHLDWVLLILTADEGSLFETKHIHHPNLILWVMTPRPDHDYPAGTRFIGEGYATDTRTVLADACTTKSTDTLFAGQVTHLRRRQMATALNDVADIVETGGFAQGLPRDAYLERLAAAKVAPAPSGPVTPDSFRLYEALEAGALPLADAVCPAYQTPGYWDMVAPGHPFPTITDWANSADAVNTALNDWPGNANHASAWWQAHKRTMAYWLIDDLDTLGAPVGSTGTLRDRVTVLIPTSPIPSHPSTDIIEQTVATIRDRLPDCEIIITIDGVRPEQEDRRADYDEYTRRLLWICNHRWRNVLPIVFSTITHQAAMAAEAMKLVRTPHIFYVEHDMPLKGEIPFEPALACLDDGTADHIKFGINTALEPTHLHLMIDSTPVGDDTYLPPTPEEHNGLPMVRTVQWSQQPHLATSSYYRDILSRWFAPGEVEYIELRMHSVCAGLWHRDGPVAWFRNRLWIFAPEGDISRCWHSDGRAGDPVYKTS